MYTKKFPQIVIIMILIASLAFPASALAGGGCGPKVEVTYWHEPSQSWKTTCSDAPIQHNPNVFPTQPPVAATALPTSVATEATAPDTNLGTDTGTDSTDLGTDATASELSDSVVVMQNGNATGWAKRTELSNNWYDLSETWSIPAVVDGIVGEWVYTRTLRCNPSAHCITMSLTREFVPEEGIALELPVEDDVTDPAWPEFDPTLLTFECNTPNNDGGCWESFKVVNLCYLTGHGWEERRVETSNVPNWSSSDNLWNEDLTVIIGGGWFHIQRMIKRQFEAHKMQYAPEGGCEALNA